MSKKNIVTTSKKLMDNQDTVNRGDSKATKTERICFCLDSETAEILTNAAHDRRISRSELLKDLIVKGLKISY